MRAFAELAAFEINRNLEIRKAVEEKRERIGGVISAGHFDRLPADLEPALPGCSRIRCLARFSATRRPDAGARFGEAAEVGLGLVLELAAIERRSAPPLLPNRASCGERVGRRQS